MDGQSDSDEANMTIRKPEQVEVDLGPKIPIVIKESDHHEPSDIDKQAIDASGNRLDQEINQEKEKDS